MSIQTAWQTTFDFWTDLPIVVEPSNTQLSSDGGLLPIRQFDEQIGLTHQFADVCWHDLPRHAKLVNKPAALYFLAAV